MDMNIDPNKVSSVVKKISGRISCLVSESSSLRSAVQAASIGINSENFEKTESSVNSTITALNTMINDLLNAQGYVNQLNSIVDLYLNVKY